MVLGFGVGCSSSVFGSWPCSFCQGWNPKRVWVFSKASQTNKHSLLPHKNGLVFGRLFFGDLYRLENVNSCAGELDDAINSTRHHCQISRVTLALWEHLVVLTGILAAASSSWIELRMVAPSSVTMTSPTDVDWGIFGPRVDFTRSPMASAPGKGEQYVLCMGVSLWLGRECDIVLSYGISSAPGPIELWIYMCGLNVR